MAPEAPTIGTIESGLATTWLRARRDTAKQVKHQEARARHRILNVVAKEPEKPHVADQVHPAAVKEHRREHVRILPPRIREADEAIAHLKGYAGAEQASELARNQAEVAHRRRERHVRACALHEQPRQCAQNDDHHGDHCGPLGFVFVVVRDHEPIVVPNRFQGCAGVVQRRDVNTLDGARGTFAGARLVRR